MKRVLISGGNFINKGAEAMLYVSANEMFTRFPGCDCMIQLGEGFYEIHSLDDLQALSVSRKKKSAGKAKKMAEMFRANKNADVMIDISGYELCSRFGMYPTLRYIFRIALSKLMKTPVYLMPQSFGPFHYAGFSGKCVNALIRHYLAYPRICFAREHQSAVLLKKAAPKATIKESVDLVLQNGIIKDRMTCFSTAPMIDVKPNSVGLVVNRRLYEQYGKENVDRKYLCILRELRKEHDVYLLCHASDDLDICQSLKARYMVDEHVHMVDEVLSCFDFQELAKSFSYVVAARYHSIVHAYKEGTPCVALGWAVKYQELLSNMKQGRYLLDIGQATEDEINEVISEMEKQHSSERQTILEQLSEIQKTNCFDEMEKDIYTIKEKKHA